MKVSGNRKVKPVWSSLLPFAMIIPIVAAASSDPFVGTWRFRSDRSKLESTYKIRAAGEGRYQVDGGLGLGPILLIDGSPHESPLGGVVSLKQIDDHTFVYTLKRQFLYKRTITLDGDQMKWAEDQELDTGKHEIFESEWLRVGQGQGLAGEWHRTKLNDPLADHETLAIHAITNGLRMKDSELKREQDIYFDGKEHAETDPAEAGGLSYTAKRMGSHSYRQVYKRNREVISTTTCNLSDDENTITCTGVDNHGQKNVIVEERVNR